MPRGAEATSDCVPPSAARELFDSIKRDVEGWQDRAFREFHGLVHGLLIKALGPHAELEDLVADVFVSFFESARNIKYPHAVRSYIVSIAMNAVRREIRRRKRRSLFMRFANAHDEIEHRPGPDDPRANAALLQLSKILDELSLPQRLAFVLHDLEGLPLPEVAVALRISHSTAKRHVKLANVHLVKRVSRNALLSDYIRERSGRVHGQS